MLETALLKNTLDTSSIYRRKPSVMMQVNQPWWVPDTQMSLQSCGRSSQNHGWSRHRHMNPLCWVSRSFVLTHKTLLQVFLTTVHILLLLTQTKAYIKILLLVLVMKQTNSKALLQLESSVPPQWPWPRGRGCYGAVTALCFTVPLQNSTCSWKSKKFIKYDFAIPEMRYEQPVKLDLFIWGIPWTKLLISCNGRMLRGWKRP